MAGVPVFSAHVRAMASGSERGWSGLASRLPRSALLLGVGRVTPKRLWEQSRRGALWWALFILI